MIDQSRVDPLLIKGVSRHTISSNKFTSACPVCGGKDRLLIRPDHTYPCQCQQCDYWGDLIDLCMRVEGRSFRQALRYLGLEGQSWSGSAQPARSSSRSSPSQRSERQPVEPPSEEYQDGLFSQTTGTRLPEQEQHLARFPDGPHCPLLTWLFESGYTIATIRAAKLAVNPDPLYPERITCGLEPATRKDGRMSSKLWVPTGIIIPWIIDGELWKMQIRRDVTKDDWEKVYQLPEELPSLSPEAATIFSFVKVWNGVFSAATLASRVGMTEHAVWDAFAELRDKELIHQPARYIEVTGGSDGLYNAHAIQSGKPVVMVESVLDALAIQQEAGDLVAPIASGASGARHRRWIERIRQANAPVLLAFDNDDGGRAPRDYWHGALEGAQVELLIPRQKDIRDMLKAGHDIRKWIERRLGSIP